MAQTLPTDFVALLDRAVSEPLIISRAYSAFHRYSIGYQRFFKAADTILRAGRVELDDVVDVASS